MKQVLKSLIAEGKIKEVIVKLLEITIQDLELHNRVTQTSARFIEYEKKMLGNLEEAKNLEIKLNKICQAILAIIDDLPESSNPLLQKPKHLSQVNIFTNLNTSEPKKMNHSQFWFSLYPFLGASLLCLLFFVIYPVINTKTEARIYSLRPIFKTDKIIYRYIQAHSKLNKGPFVFSFKLDNKSMRKINDKNPLSSDQQLFGASINGDYTDVTKGVFEMNIGSFKNLDYFAWSINFVNPKGSKLKEDDIDFSFLKCEAEDGTFVDDEFNFLDWFKVYPILNAILPLIIWFSLNLIKKINYVHTFF